MYYIQNTKTKCNVARCTSYIIDVAHREPQPKETEMNPKKTGTRKREERKTNGRRNRKEEGENEPKGTKK